MLVSKNLEQSQYFAIGPSRILRLAVMGMHLLALLASCLNSLPTGYQAVLSVLVLLSAWMNRDGGRSGSVALRYTPDQRWWLALDGKDFQLIRIQSSTVISSGLIFLHWVCDENIRGVVVIANDAMTANDYRKLMVYLKITQSTQG